MGFSHIGISVPASKFDETVAFYLATLAPLGYKEHVRPAPHVVGLGIYYPDFWISKPPPPENEEGDDTTTKYVSTHVAFSVNSRELVHAFHTAGLKAGGTCNGPPGPRPQYTRTYYASFLIDPAGNNIETVCMWPAWSHLGYWVGSGQAFSKKKKGE
ncbi:hypothetical protein AJ80_05520 [Polytolypa hystricis UAMH7299]|uniref:VOC domain-containing protein n=1 Tax=Polytolypa hystricis (strain UAMH7299) TaxID=1447883 RepID=A0A2B7Y399_POLH7|nr:hypothetical protein AJ80_05520 [Polytolypa hystricis UAMH7299]